MDSPRRTSYLSLCAFVQNLFWDSGNAPRYDCPNETNKTKHGNDRYSDQRPLGVVSIATLASVRVSGLMACHFECLFRKADKGLVQRGPVNPLRDDTIDGV